MMRIIVYVTCCLLLTAGATAADTSSVRLSASDEFWSRGVAVVSITKPLTARAIIDTGGSTELRKQHPRDFDTYYHGLPIDMAIGADYLAHHRVLLAHSDEGVPKHVPLDVITKGDSTYAFVNCKTGTDTLKMLLDTAALAWTPDDAARTSPIGVTFVGKAKFATLQSAKENRAGPSWQIMNESGHFVTEPSLLAASLQCGGVTTNKAVFVERSDNTTYDYLRKTFGLSVDGDVGLGGLAGRGWVIDFPGKLLTVSRNGYAGRVSSPKALAGVLL